ncbi:MAG: DUF4185 domain-containing protein [Polyangiaceae bacterium]|nr:DUF4185 domain-containing protein [Polyangiaceae bacterium]
MRAELARPAGRARPAARRARVAPTLAVAATALVGCRVTLDDAIEQERPAPSPPALEACAPLPSEGDGLEARLASLPGPPLGVEGSLVVADAARGGPRGFAVRDSPCDAGEVALPATPILDASPLGPRVVARPTSLVAAGATAFVFFAAERPDSSAAFGVAAVGRGLARWDAAAGAFVDPVLLWTADRPSYGAGAAASGDYLYAYGGLAARFLSADVYLARVATARAAEPGAWEYWSGGGAWAPTADAAWPMVEGGTEPTVGYHVALERWLLAYSTPLGAEITVRTGLGPYGPWSRPYLAARCALPSVDEESFCTHVVLHPALATEDSIGVSHGVGSFHRAPSAPPSAYRARWGWLPLSSALP